MVRYRVAHTNQPAVTFMKLDNFDNLLTPERMERLNTLSPKACPHTSRGGTTHQDPNTDMAFGLVASEEAEDQRKKT